MNSVLTKITISSLNVVNIPNVFKKIRNNLNKEKFTAYLSRIKNIFETKKV